MKPEIRSINYLLASFVGSALLLGVASEREASSSEAIPIPSHTLSLDQAHIPIYPFPKIAVLKPASGETPDMDFGHTSEFQDYALDSMYKKELEQEAEDTRIKEEEKSNKSPVLLFMQELKKDKSVTIKPTIQNTVSSSCPNLISSVLGWAGCAVSFCESGWDSTAIGSEGELGDLQIHPIHPDATADRAGNVAAAKRISKGGTDWSAWTERVVLQTGYCSDGVRTVPQ